ncbi:MAG: TIGR03545 family protein [Planctomycetaceae bacterium]|nr:TIGR03545 family protein [Planctomycetaceae bacterium]
MRWSYLIPRLILVTIVWSFFAFAFDPLVRYAVVAGGQAAIGARVNVDDLQTEFFPPSINVGRIQLADAAHPGTNLMETSGLTLQLEGRPLLEKRFVVREATLRGVQWGTERADSGLLDTPPGTPTDLTSVPTGGVKEWIAEKSKDSLTAMLEAAKAGLDPRVLESVRLTEQKHEWWNRRFTEYQKQLHQLEERTKTLQDGVEQAKGNAFEKLEAYQKAAGEVRVLLGEADRIRREINDLPQIAQLDFREIDAARQRDQQQVVDMVQSFRIDSETLARSLLGPELSDKLQQSLDWMTRIRTGLAKISAEPEPERYRGVDIVFNTREPEPRLLIHRLLLDGSTKYESRTVSFSGMVTDLTSSPQLHGIPCVARIKATDGAGADIVLQATLDETRENASHQLLLDVALARPLEWMLGRSTDEFQLKASAGASSWRADLQLAGEKISGTVSLLQKETQLSPVLSKPMEEQFGSVLRHTTDSITQVEAYIAVTGTVLEPKWTVTSPLGGQLAGAVNSVFQQEVETRRTQLVARMNQEIDQRLAGFEQSLNTQYSSVLSQLDLRELRAKELIQRVAGRQGLPGAGALDLFRR